MFKENRAVAGYEVETVKYEQSKAK